MQETQEVTNIIWPWPESLYDPFDEILVELDVCGAAERFFASKKAGKKFNHKIRLQYEGDELQVLWSFRNANEKVELRNIHAILKRDGYDDAVFDIIEHWDGVRTFHGFHAEKDRQWSSVWRIADILDMATIANMRNLKSMKI
jgi:hypothetical protein